MIHRSLNKITAVISLEQVWEQLKAIHIGIRIGASTFKMEEIFLKK